jgi:hypothetical protein
MMSRASPLSRKYHSASSQARLNAAPLIYPSSPLSVFLFSVVVLPSSLCSAQNAEYRKNSPHRSILLQRRTRLKQKDSELFTFWQEKVIFSSLWTLEDLPQKS